MANKVKVDANYAKSLIAANSSRSAFINDISAKYNVSKEYASFLYYKLKKGLSQSVASAGIQASADQQDSGAVESISPENVVVTNQTPNKEAEDLKKAYSKLFEEKTGVSPEEAAESEEEAVEGKQFEEEAEGGAEEEISPEMTEKQLRIKLGALLKQIGVAINNNILWKERPLEQDEIDNISAVSHDIEANFGEGLEGPYSPYYNYLLFTIAAPLIARIDLLPDKMRGFNNWLRSTFGKSRSANAPGAPQSTPGNSGQQAAGVSLLEKGLNEKVPSFAEPTHTIGLSDTQLELLKNLKEQGYEIAEDFDPNKPIDYEAFKNKIARNVKISI